MSEYAGWAGVGIAVASLALGIVNYRSQKGEPVRAQQRDLRAAVLLEARHLLALIAALLEEPDERRMIAAGLLSEVPLVSWASPSERTRFRSQKIPNLIDSHKETFEEWTEALHLYQLAVRKVQASEQLADDPAREQLSQEKIRLERAELSARAQTVVDVSRRTKHAAEEIKQLIHRIDKRSG